MPQLPVGPMIVRRVAPSWYDPPDMPNRKAPLPALGSLHLRHPGLYEPLCRAFAPPGVGLEQAQRLEVSGTKTGALRDLHSRLRQKVRQTQRGLSRRPALACVVGFRIKMVALASLEMEGGDA